jgi:hypothetical protein
MAKSAAQRQAEYRGRRPFAGDNGERRLSLWIRTGAALALDRLARRYGVTKREMIERLIVTQDEVVLATIALDSPEWDEYIDARSVTR